MSERKLYRFYRPRIQIPVGDMTSHPGECLWYCLPVDGAQALLRIAPYLRRPITYPGEYLDEKTYNGPTETELTTIHELIDELEEGLMAGCDLALIEEYLERIADAQEQLAECTCSSAAASATETARMPDVSEYVTAEDINYLIPSENYANCDPIITDVLKCEAAQSVYYYIFQQYTETILPWSGESADALVAAIIATVGFGALFSFVGIPIAIAAGIVSVTVNWQVSGSISNFVNWMYGAKDDLICIYYRNFDDYAAAAEEARLYIDSQDDISFLDRQLAKMYFGSTWWYTWIIKDQQANDTWRNYFVADQCDECSEIPTNCQVYNPCVLDDWTFPESGDLVCNGAYPQIKDNYAIYDETTLTVPDWDGWIDITYVIRGTDPTGNAQFNLYAGDGQEQHIQFDPEPQVAVDVPQHAIHHFNSHLVGEALTIQVVKDDWYTDVRRMCVYDYDPS